METFDLIVVGAAPLASLRHWGALRARPAARVLLMDRAPPGRDKVCGDGVGPDAVRELARVGLPDILRPEEQVSRYRLVVGSGATVAGTAPRRGTSSPAGS